MTRRILLGLALVGAAYAGLDCNQIYGLKPTTIDRPNAPFVGCFTGPITEPPGSSALRIVIEAPKDSTHSLTGCMQGMDPRFDATHTGVVDSDDRTRATVTVMPQGRPAFAMTIQRQPAGPFEDAVTVTLVNETGFPFKTAADLPRCTQTCADLALPQSFAPGGGQ